MCWAHRRYLLGGLSAHGSPVKSLFSLSFVGASSQYVDLGASVTIQPTAAATISMWFKTSTAGFMQLMSNANAANNLNGVQVALDVPSRFAGWIGSGAAFQKVGSTAAVDDGAWHHGCFTFDGANLFVFVDGVQVGTAVQGITPTSGTFNTIVGADTGHTSPWTGNIDDVRIYARALSSVEVATLASGNNPSSANLVGWWKFDDGSGMTAVDSSGSGINGTLVNGPTYSVDVPSQLQ